MDHHWEYVDADQPGVLLEEGTTLSSAPLKMPAPAVATIVRNGPASYTASGPSMPAQEYTTYAEAKNAIEAVVTANGDTVDAAA